MGYFILAKGGLVFATINSFASPIWPASGFAIAAVLRFKRTATLAVFCAAAVASFTTASALTGVLLIGVGNTLEALIGAKLLSSPFDFMKLQNNNKFNRILLLAALAPAASALIGVGALLSVGIVAPELYARTLVTWWTGDSLGILLLFPLLFQTLADREKPAEASALNRASRKLFLNTKMLCGLGIAVFYLVCFFALVHFPQLGGGIFVVLVPLLISGLFLSDRGLHFTALGASLIVIALDVLDRGPLSDLPLNDRLIGLQLITFSIALTGLALAQLRTNVPVRYFARELAAGWLLTGTIFFLLHRNLAHEEQRRFSAIAFEEAKYIQRELAILSEIVKEKYLRSLLAAEKAEQKFDSEKVWLNFTASLATNQSFKTGAALRAAALYAVSPDSQVSSLRQGRLFEKSWGSSTADSQQPEESVKLQIVFSPKDWNEASMAFLNPPFEQVALELVLDARLLLQQAPFHDDSDPGLFVSLAQAEQAADQKSETKPAARNVLQSFLHLSNKSQIIEEPIVLEGKAGLVLKVQRKRSVESASDFSLAWSAGLGALLSLAIAQIVASSRSVQMRAEKLAESKTKILEKQTLFLNGIVEGAPVAMLQVSSRGQIRFVNQMARELFAFNTPATVPDGPRRPEKMNWNDLSLLLDPKDQGPFCNALEKARTQNSAVMLEGSFRFGSESQAKILQFRMLALLASRTPAEHSLLHEPYTEDVNQSASELEKHGVPDCIVLVLDVTREKMAQRQLEAEQLRSIQSAKMATLGEMAGGIAHEINNPLAIVDLCAHQLEIMLESGLVQEEIVQRNTQKIRATIQRIAAIVRGLKSFARDTSRDPLRHESPIAIVNECIALCESRLRRQNIIVTAVLPQSMPLLPCIGNQIMQVLLNLISNAADALENQPIRKINVGLEHHTKNSKTIAMFYVEDTGPGVPETLRAKIMNPFFTTKPVGKGTGLGLSISSSIATSHEGLLYLDTNRKHTRFVLEIPYEVSHERQAAHSASVNLIDVKKPA